MPGSVGVIVAAHNAARFLPETLASFKRQTLQPDVVIVVDDGSTDETKHIAEAWGARVISVPNGGVSRARNIGIAAIDTTFVAFCDADDVWEPTKLEKQRAALLENPECSFAFCDYYDFVGNAVQHRSILSDVFDNFDRTAFERVGPGRYRCDRARINAQTVERSFILPSTFFIRNDVLQVLAPFKEDFAVEEDVEFLLRLFTRTDAIFVDEPLMGYRRHSTNATADPRRQRVGMLRLAAHVTAHAANYRPESAPHYRAMFPTYLFKAGRMYASLGDVKMARWFLARSFELAAKPQTALWFLLAPLFHVGAVRRLAGRARGA